MPVKHETWKAADDDTIYEVIFGPDQLANFLEEPRNFLLAVKSRPKIRIAARYTMVVMRRYGQKTLSGTRLAAGHFAASGIIGQSLILLEGGRLTPGPSSMGTLPAPTTIDVVSNAGRGVPKSGVFHFQSDSSATAALYVEAMIQEPAAFVAALNDPNAAVNRMRTSRGRQLPTSLPRPNFIIRDLPVTFAEGRSQGMFPCIQGRFEIEPASVQGGPETLVILSWGSKANPR